MRSWSMFEVRKTRSMTHSVLFRALHSSRILDLNMLRNCVDVVLHHSDSLRREAVFSEFNINKTSFSMSLRHPASQIAELTLLYPFHYQLKPVQPSTNQTTTKTYHFTSQHAQSFATPSALVDCIRTPTATATRTDSGNHQ